LIAAKTNEPSPTGYYQEMPYPNPTIQQEQPLPIGNPMMTAAGDYPFTCTCPYCQQPIVTKAEKDSGLAVWLAAGTLCVFGCIFGCCLIPFCIDDLKV
jgi:lipopolysaccharide-induced tumor necrosis factor-alpha factor